MHTYVTCLYMFCVIHIQANVTELYLRFPTPDITYITNLPGLKKPNGNSGNPSEVPAAFVGHGPIPAEFPAVTVDPGNRRKTVRVLRFLFIILGYNCITFNCFNILRNVQNNIGVCRYKSFGKQPLVFYQGNPFDQLFLFLFLYCFATILSTSRKMNMIES